MVLGALAVLQEPPRFVNPEAMIRVPVITTVIRPAPEAVIRPVHPNGVARPNTTETSIDPRDLSVMIDT